MLSSFLISPPTDALLTLTTIKDSKELNYKDSKKLNGI